MLAIATTDDEIEALTDRLRRFAVRSSDLRSPGATRRVLLIELRDESVAERVAVALRAEGWMAVTRPAGGAALEAWQRSTRPITIGDRLSICLAWSEHTRTDLPGLIELGPGGFGSGHHPTTQMIARVLVDRVVDGARVLDVGCGSGVLALSAIRVGAAGAMAVDLKPEAVAATRRNAALNDMAARVEATTRPLTELDATFDLVVANIARAGIVALAADLVAKVAPGGVLVVSGIGPSQCDQVIGFLRPLVVTEHLRSGDWSALVLARP